MSYPRLDPTRKQNAGPNQQHKWSLVRRREPAMFEASVLTSQIHQVQRKDISTVQINGLSFVVATGLLALSGCAEAPIAKTNCWATAPQTSISSMGTVSRSASAPSTLPAGSVDAANCE